MCRLRLVEPEEAGAKVKEILKSLFCFPISWPSWPIQKLFWIFSPMQTMGWKSRSYWNNICNFFYYHGELYRQCRTTGNRFSWTAAVGYPVFLTERPKWVVLARAHLRCPWTIILPCFRCCCFSGRSPLEWAIFTAFPWDFQCNTCRHRRVYSVVCPEIFAWIAGADCDLCCYRYRHLFDSRLDRFFRPGIGCYLNFPAWRILL